MTSVDEPAAVYRRVLPVSLARVWENVYDWEHLPWLHRRSFCGIALEDAGAWGWRARVQLPPAERPTPITIELSVDRPRLRYTTRTLAGPGQGTSILTVLEPRAERETAITVSFFVPGVAGEAAATVGRQLETLYAQLWDEDESMMRRRQELLDARPRRRAGGVGPRPPVALGSAKELSRSGGRIVEAWGVPFRVLASEGRWVAHATECPHRGGPLEDAAVESSSIVCPWHGYRFGMEDGGSEQKGRCRALPLARVHVDPGRDEASLHWVS